MILVVSEQIIPTYEENNYVLLLLIYSILHSRPYNCLYRSLPSLFISHSINVDVVLATLIIWFYIIIVIIIIRTLIIISFYWKETQFFSTECLPRFKQCEKTQSFVLEPQINPCGDAKSSLKHKIPLSSSTHHAFFLETSSSIE